MPTKAELESLVVELMARVAELERRQQLDEADNEIADGILLN